MNAACLALVDAGVALRDFVAACGLTVVQRALLLDPSHAECSAGGPELVVAMLPRSGKLTLATMDARLPMDLLDPCLALATEGCGEVYAVMRDAAREATIAKALGRGGGGGGGGGGEGEGRGGEEGDDAVIEESRGEDEREGEEAEGEEGDAIASGER